MPHPTPRIERKPKLSERVVAALREQILSGRDRARAEAADRGPADRNVRRQPHRHPRGDRQPCGRRAGRTAPGRRRLRARPSDASPSARSARRSAARSARRSTCSKYAWASRSRARASRRTRRNAAQEARDPGGVLRVRAPAQAGRADRQGRFRLPPRDRVGDQQSVLCRDSRRARRPHHPLRRHLALVFRRTSCRRSI